MISALPVSGAWQPKMIGAHCERPRISLSRRELHLAVALAAELGTEVARPQTLVADPLLQRIDDLAQRVRRAARTPARATRDRSARPPRGRTRPPSRASSGTPGRSRSPIPSPSPFGPTPNCCTRHTGRAHRTQERIRVSRADPSARAIGEVAVVVGAGDLVDGRALPAVARPDRHLVEAAAQWSVPLRPTSFGVEPDRPSAFEDEVDVARDAGDVVAVAPVARLLARLRRPSAGRGGSRRPGRAHRRLPARSNRRCRCARRSAAPSATPRTSLRGTGRRATSTAGSGRDHGCPTSDRAVPTTA